MESLRWLGLDWDGEVTYQLDRMERCREEAQRLVAEGSAYEDEGAIRIRMPDEGSTAWEDLVRGHIEVPSEKLEDLVAVRADGRPTYNFASPVEDWLDGITHVIRGEDHISNTPKQIRVLEALGAEPPALRAPRQHLRARRQEALQAARRRLGGGVPARRLLRARAPQLPRAPRLELRRSHRDLQPRRPRPALHPRAGRREPGGLRLRQAQAPERRLRARALARRSTRARSSPGSGSRATSGTRSSSGKPRRSSRRRSRPSASSPPSPASSSTASPPNRRSWTARHRSSPKRVRRWPRSSPSTPSGSRRPCASWPSARD